VRDEALIITAPEDAASQLATRVYDVRSLHETEVSLFDSNDRDTLLNLIRNHLHSDTWNYRGGPGAIDAFRGLLVVSQTEPVHTQIEFLLAELRRSMLWRDQPEVMASTKPSPAEQAISAA